MAAEAPKYRDQCVPKRLTKNDVNRCHRSAMIRVWMACMAGVAVRIPTFPHVLVAFRSPQCQPNAARTVLRECHRTGCWMGTERQSWRQAGKWPIKWPRQAHGAPRARRRSSEWAFLPCFLSRSRQHSPPNQALRQGRFPNQRAGNWIDDKRYGGGIFNTVGTCEVVRLAHNQGNGTSMLVFSTPFSQYSPSRPLWLF